MENRIEYDFQSIEWYPVQSDGRDFVELAYTANVDPINGELPSIDECYRDWKRSASDAFDSSLQNCGIKLARFEGRFDRAMGKRVVRAFIRIDLQSIPADRLKVLARSKPASSTPSVEIAGIPIQEF